MARIVEDCIRAWRDSGRARPLPSDARVRVPGRGGDDRRLARSGDRTCASTAICTILDWQDRARTPKGLLCRARCGRTRGPRRYFVHCHPRTTPSLPCCAGVTPRRSARRAGAGGRRCAEIQSHLTILLIAGHETGATLYSRALYVLAQMPRLAATLAAELNYAQPSARAQSLGADEAR